MMVDRVNRVPTDPYAAMSHVLQQYHWQQPATSPLCYSQQWLNATYRDTVILLKHVIFISR